MGTLNLLKCMSANGCMNLVFSSSATVYGASQAVPFNEEEPVSTTNPYGSTKLFIERILFDLVTSDTLKAQQQQSSSAAAEAKTTSVSTATTTSTTPNTATTVVSKTTTPKSSSRVSPKWRIVILRYFNPIGAHESGLLGEDPNGIPNNLVPYLTQVAVGKLAQLSVYGKDYDTPDGTGVRDYIHVVDLALGHLAALSNGIFGDSMKTDCEAFNLGSGQGNSVLQLIGAMEKACGKSIPYKVVGRRPGDVAKSYADPSKAKRDLKWQTKYTLQEAINDAWRWQKMNPKGFSG
jgi:UDP-glucose 4-epimerase